MPHKHNGRKQQQRELAIAREQQDMDLADQARVNDPQPWRRGFTFPAKPTVRVPDYTAWQAQKKFDRRVRNERQRPAIQCQAA